MTDAESLQPRLGVGGPQFFACCSVPIIEFLFCRRRHALNFREAPGNNCMSFLLSFLTHKLLSSNSMKYSLQVTVGMFLTQRKIIRPTTKIEGNKRIFVIPSCQNRGHLFAPVCKSP